MHPHPIQMKPSEKGFTLIELLISVLLLTFIGGVLLTTFSQGLRLWRYAVQERSEWKVDLFFEKFNSHIRNSLFYELPAIQGDHDSVEFYALAEATRFQGKETGQIKLPTQLHYFYDDKTESIFLEKKVYPAFLNPKAKKSSSELVLEGVKDFKMEYFVPDEERKKWFWKTHWTEACFPKAIKASLDFEDVRKRKMVRYFSFPVTQSCS